MIRIYLDPNNTTTFYFYKLQNVKINIRSLVKIFKENSINQGENLKNVDNV